MKKTTIYSYADTGDLVHCNNCDVNMLVPAGADKCPHCYYEGSLGWFDDNNKEATHSKLESNPDYTVISNNDPEMTEYLSDETLRDEFGMKSNSQHKYKNK